VNSIFADPAVWRQCSNCCSPRRNEGVASPRSISLSARNPVTWIRFTQTRSNRRLILPLLSSARQPAKTAHHGAVPADESHVAAFNGDSAAARILFRPRRRTSPAVEEFGGHLLRVFASRRCVRSSPADEGRNRTLLTRSSVSSVAMMGLKNASSASSASVFV